MKTIHFNTGRKYTAAGQRITATMRDDGLVTFYDHDRMIDGQYQEPSPRDFGQVTVMDQYDTGGYHSGAQSFHDGMTLEGLNSKWEE